jgi:hypothetical protein
MGNDKKLRSLHITNGDSAVGGLREAGFSGVFLPIRDALHVGPLLPDDDLLAEDSARCRFIIDQGWGSAQKVRQFQQERREVLSQLADFEHITLWFEHDLYDQLQLVWFLQFLADKAVTSEQVSLVVTDQYLGEATVEDWHELTRFAEPLTAEHMLCGQRVWQQLTSHEPLRWPELLGQYDELMPFLSTALRRFFREFPAVNNGLGLSAQQALQVLSEPMPAGQLFARTQAMETARFMADLPFFDLLDSLAEGETPLLSRSGKEPLLENPAQKLMLTTAGQQVLSGERHYLDLGFADFWLGGVHIHKDNQWCYHDQQSCFIRRTS